VTDGCLEWDSETGTFDWLVTTALPPEVAYPFADEPRYPGTFSRQIERRQEWIRRLSSGENTFEAATLHDLRVEGRY